ncbi:MAG: adenylate/guanylate cyclase domain-containing protein [Xanthobacteraceae bacterium]|nr:adenylate/guanylate cyclase domain-containing protein [Xanthobacteraceae bacterium]
MDSAETHSVIRWLMADARKFTEPSEFLDAFARRLLEAGVAVTRVTTGVPLLHPQIASFSGLWQLGKGVSERRYHAVSSTMDALLNSPIVIAYRGEGPVRCLMTGPPNDQEFPIVKELRAEGLTDYVVLSIPFADGSHKALSLAANRPEGFREDEIALFNALVPAFAFNLEIQTLRLTARTLLDTYVGRQAGARVLDGQIRRGMGETINAVIWLCDLRGFTSLSERLERDALIELLNQYFGPMCDAVENAGGEVLKFIGDAMLAIFPVADAPGPACQQALAAAATARAALEETNRARVQAGLPRIAYGLALHVGEVLYGNIGGETRLDLTVIGPAVNLTARIESLCGELKRELLLSADFVATARIPADEVGEFELHGVGERQRVFALREPA